MTTHKRKILFSIGSGFVVLLVLVASLNHAAIARQMHAWKLLPEPERLTELYFTDHTKLPTTYTPSEMQTVTFTVHNLEYRTTTYHYSITQASEDGSQTQELASGDFTLQQDKYQKASAPITLADFGPRSKVAVTLTNTKESISYWLTKGGA